MLGVGTKVRNISTQKEIFSESCHKYSVIGLHLLFFQIDLGQTEFHLVPKQSENDKYGPIPVE